MRKAGLRDVMCGKVVRTTVADAKAPYRSTTSTASSRPSGRISYGRGAAPWITVADITIVSESGPTF
jgi:hypothetical protein